MDWEAYHRLARRACFVCELLAGNPEYPHHVVYQDGVAVAFLNRFPLWPGHVLVAPVSHVEGVVASGSCGRSLSHATAYQRPLRCDCDGVGQQCAPSAACRWRVAVDLRRIPPAATSEDLGAGRGNVPAG